MRKVTVDGRDVVLANVDGEYLAVGDVCTHQEGPLDEGILHEYEVECPWHGSRFDLRTGAVREGPAENFIGLILTIILVGFVLIFIAQILFVVAFFSSQTILEGSHHNHDQWDLHRLN